ncbi:putative T7SS-secreted protein [Streptomyces sp. NBC_01794]|uniref:putative T7SS-secreted protein n=1 Tax=Streptomyces sp. NBC_01794 TaxID=2975942 RepID=UPI0030914A13|nr:DUF6531 domain-containing protein [Streptomyces sp. NBC_01794]
MPDWGKLADKGIDAVGDGIDKAKEKVGEGVDWATDKVGDGLDHMGQHTMADVVEDWGDRTASSLGAEVGEQQLGESEQANELIHGNPGKIAESVKNLRDFQKAFDLVGGGMKKLDSSHWKGEAADTFRDEFQTLPTDWLYAADAFEDAAKALETYSKSITSAQDKAREAIALYKEGDESSKTATDEYNKKVNAYNAARNGDHPLPDPGEFSDPGQAKRERAQEILKEARRHRNEAAETAKTAVTAAMAHAPKEPTGRERLNLEVMDYSLGQSFELAHVGGGIVKGTAGLLNFVRSVDPMDPYNLTHPAEYYKGVNMTLAGLASTAANPDRALKNAWDAAKGDPSEFIGRLIPEIVGSKGTGLARGGFRLGVKNGAEAAAESGARRAVRDTPESHAENPRNKVERDPTDPVDLTTGAMYLPQTDITLPGVLPLVFTRRVESGYGLGRWFGPSWSSTVDERLEIDAEGVVFVSADGLLLAYPHPAPGTPTLPSHGPRWPLDRADGGYTITDPATGRVRHFADRAEHLAVLEQVDDRNGQWLTFEYDAEGAPLAIVSSGGHHLKITTRDERVIALHLAGAAVDGSDQEIKRYVYSDDGHLTEVINSSGLPLQFTYDERGRITSWTDTNDRSYTYEYDEQDRCVAEGGAEGHMSLRLSYDETDPGTGHRITTTTTGEGHTRRYLINSAFQVVAEIDPLGNVTRFERDRHNRLLSRTDPLGHTARYEYDDRGNLTRAVRVDGREIRAHYNELDLPVKVIGTDGSVHRYYYDELGNRTGFTNPAAQSTTFTYDDAGRLTSVVDPLGHTTTVRCDPAGLPLQMTDPSGAVTRYERDAFGRPVTITDPAGATTRLQWTVEGLLARRIAPDGTTESWTYDGEGNRTGHTDPLGGTTRYEYTHFDLMSARTDPDGARHEFLHDEELRLTQVTNPQGLNWSYEYDRAGRLIAETDFDDGTLTYTHDPAGRLASRTNALGQTTTYERDALGQIVRKDADGQVTTYAYDVTDRLAQAVGPGGSTLTLLRDQHGNLRTETVDGRSITCVHDSLGRRTSRTTPGGATTTWSYDPVGNVAEMTASGRPITFTYDGNGREVTRTVADTLSLDQGYDPMGRLTAQTTMADERTIQHRAYTYRADGHLTGVEDLLSGQRRFDLDARGRVTAVHAANWTEAYAYDAAGNQTQASWPAVHPGHEATGERVYTGTRLTRAGNVRYEHDALGRIVLRRKTRLSRRPDTWRYEWDAEDRLTATVTPDGTRWRYTYDPLGRRTAKLRLSADGDTVVERVTFTWDGTMLCEQTSVSQELPHPVTLTWDHQGLHPIAQTERITAADAPQEEIDSRFFSIITDLIGTPTELVDEQSTIAWHTRATLWGSTTWPADSPAYTPLRFPGQYHDPETGLHYNYFRHYDPETARYLTPDPLGLTPAPNPGAYVHNPHTWSDPLGLAPKCPEEKAKNATEKIIERAQEGKMRKASNYHPHFGGDERVIEILQNPDAVYLSQGGRGNLIFRQGEDIVITKGHGAGAGDVITGYGPSGIKGETGVKAVGGSVNDPGPPVTHDDIVNGKIPDTNGGTMPPAKQIR